MTCAQTTENTAAKAASTAKTRQGVVVKAKMQKTVVVEVVRRVRHPKYVKFVSQRDRYFAHDESDNCEVGDKVIIEETRPLSKQKRWRVRQVIERATGA